MDGESNIIKSLLLFIQVRRRECVCMKKVCNFIVNDFGVNIKREKAFIYKNHLHCRVY